MNQLKSVMGKKQNYLCKDLTRSNYFPLTVALHHMDSKFNCPAQ